VSHDAFISPGLSPEPEITDGSLSVMVDTIACQMLKVRGEEPYDNVPETPGVPLADSRIPAGFADKVRRFLTVPEISCDPLRRAHITDVNIQSCTHTSGAHGYPQLLSLRQAFHHRRASRHPRGRATHHPRSKSRRHPMRRRANARH
jgi:hypothetical protein